MTLLERLALYGVGVHIVGGNRIKLTGLDRVPVEYGQTVKVLIEEARVRKAEIIHSLLHDGFTELTAADGDIRECMFSVHAEKEMRRWACALDNGLIHLIDKIIIHIRNGTAHIRYRCALPDEWLQDIITASAKRQYNSLLERIRKGETWLMENANHPNHDNHHSRFLALFEELRQLYCLIDEPLTDPMDGYAVSSLLSHSSRIDASEKRR